MGRGGAFLPHRNEVKSHKSIGRGGPLKSWLFVLKWHWGVGGATPSSPSQFTCSTFSWRHHRLFSSRLFPSCLPVMLYKKWNEKERFCGEEVHDNKTHCCIWHRWCLTNHRWSPSFLISSYLGSSSSSPTPPPKKKTLTLPFICLSFLCEADTYSYASLLDRGKSK